MSNSLQPEVTPISLNTVVIDTNVFVAAGFNPSSHAARIVQAIKEGGIQMVWNEATRREILAVLRRIPPLASYQIDDLFREDSKFVNPTFPEHF